MKIIKLVRTNADVQARGWTEQPADTLAVAVEGQPLTVSFTPEQLKELTTYPYNITFRSQEV